jgi:hypothetical protein
MKKKNLIIFFIILFLILTTILFIVFSRKGDKTTKKYPDELIKQESLIPTKKGNITFEGIKDPLEETYKLYGVSDEVSLSGIENMISTLNLRVELENLNDSFIYNGTDGENIFNYYLSTNTFYFSLKGGISWHEAQLTERSFSSFVKKYFNKTWEYELVEVDKGVDGTTFYYAKRLVPDGTKIESLNTYQNTDYLALKDGRITSGEILLVEFFDTQLDIPLIGVSNLTKYINLEEYPKIIESDIGRIASALSITEEPYSNQELFDKLFKLREELEDCKTNKLEVVYYYKSFKQTYLTPVYRLDLFCDVLYENRNYTIPAIAYVNAIDPEYIYIPE